MFIVLLIMFASCNEITKYSEIPQIKYERHFVTDSINALGNEQLFLQLTFSVIDGDGDIGLMDGDTVAPYDSIYEYNFFPKLFIKTLGIWEEATLLNEGAYYRIPYIDIENHKAYKAEIDIEFQYFSALLPGDTIKYEFYMLDRALNQSNTATTPEILLNNVY